MGRKIVLTGTTLTDLNAPKLALVDPIESAGSLLLLDATHPIQQWTAGIPASGATLPNLVWANAAEVYGKGSQAELSPTVSYANLDGVTRGKIERTAKGGLHGIMSQTDARVTEGTGLMPSLRIDVGTIFREWQYLHPDHSLYMSIWERVTRPMRTGTVGGTYTDGQTRFAYIATSNNNLRVPMGRYVGGFGNKLFDLGRRADDEAVIGPVFANAGSSGWNTVPASATDTRAEIVTIGGTGVNNTVRTGVTSAPGRWPSHVIYRVYVEDLAVSGRTYSEVDVLDFALYTKEVLTSGGRYYGDTFTDPATIP